MSLLATSALAALVVIASVTDADALSTVALTLAILAFVVQIMVYIAQSWTTGQQTVQSQELNANTLAALAELRTRAAGTETILAKHADTAMRFAFERTIIESRKENLSADEALDRFEEAYETAPLDEDAVEPYKPPEEDIEIVARLLSYPDENEAAETLGLFTSLSPLAGSTLDLVAKDERDSRLSGSRVGVKVKTADSPGVVELMSKGIIEWASEWDDFVGDLVDDAGAPQRYVRLTLLGREVARYLHGRGPVPEHVRAALADAQVGSEPSPTRLDL